VIPVLVYVVVLAAYVPTFAHVQLAPVPPGHQLPLYPVSLLALSVHVTVTDRPSVEATALKFDGAAGTFGMVMTLEYANAEEPTSL
jgi:hypothetical protein